MSSTTLDLEISLERKVCRGGGRGSGRWVGVRVGLVRVGGWERVAGSRAMLWNNRAAQLLPGQAHTQLLRPTHLGCGQVHAVVVAQVVVGHDRGGLDARAHQEVNQHALHLGLAALEVVAACGGGAEEVQG